MKIIAEIIGWLVIIFISMFFVIFYVFDNNDWVERPESKGTICNMNKGWFEWPDPKKEKCIMYWDSLVK